MFSTAGGPANTEKSDNGVETTASRLEEYGGGEYNATAKRGHGAVDSTSNKGGESNRDAGGDEVAGAAAPKAVTPCTR